MKDFRDAELYRFRLPLTQPLTLAQGVLEYREGLLLHIIDEDGHEGWGEASPLPGFSRETFEEAESCLRAILHCDDEFGDLLEQPWPSSTAFAVRGAIQSYAEDALGIAMARIHWPGREPILKVQALLVGDDGTLLERAATLRACGGNGCTTAKLKVGRGPVGDDIQRVRALSEALGDAFALRLDANRAWDLAEAVAFAEELRGVRVEYIEEPTKDPMQLPEFTRQTGMAYALDESLRDAMGVAEDVMRAATAFVVKPSLAGFEPPESCRATPRVVSAAFESGVGIAALAAQAFAENPDRPAGLDTYSWLAEDVLEEPLPLAPGLVNIDSLLAAARRVDLSKLERIA